MQGKKRLFKHYQGFYSPDKNKFHPKRQDSLNNCGKRAKLNFWAFLNQIKEKIFKRPNLHQP